MFGRCKDVQNFTTVIALLTDIARREVEGAVIYVERNYGRDMCTLAIDTAWKALQEEGAIPRGELKPLIDAVSAKQCKLLRAEPIAQQMVEDRIRLRGAFEDRIRLRGAFEDRIRLRGAFVNLKNEWATWQPTDADSPGRIDASCVLVYGLIPEANQGAIVHAPLPTTPRGGLGRGLPPTGPASPYGRGIGN